MSATELSAVRFFVVSAWLPEQQWLVDLFSNVRGRVDHSESLTICGDVGFLRTGVGTPRTAAVLTHAVSLVRQSGATLESVLFVATAGSYLSEYELGTSHLVSASCWSDGHLISGNAYLPGVPDGIVTFSSSLSPFSNSPLRAVSTPGITCTEELALTLKKHGELENLELFGVSTSAELMQIPWGAALGVSNYVGINSHSEWKTHHTAASEAAQKLAYECYLRRRM